MCASPASRQAPAACRSCAEHLKLLLLAYHTHCFSCLYGRRLLRCSLQHFSISVRLQIQRHVHIYRSSDQADIACSSRQMSKGAPASNAALDAGTRCCDSLTLNIKAARVSAGTESRGPGYVETNLLSDGLLCLGSGLLL